jgi:hypothetical protein
LFVRVIVIEGGRSSTDLRAGAEGRVCLSIFGDRSAPPEVKRQWRGVQDVF